MKVSEQSRLQLKIEKVKR